MARARQLLTTSLKIGNLSTKNAFGREIVQEITQAAIAKGGENYIKELATYRRTLEDAGNQEARRLMPFITRHMMKIQSISSAVPNPVRGAKPAKIREDYQTITADDMETMADRIFTYTQTGRAPKGPGLRWRKLTRRWRLRKGFQKPFFVGETGDLKRTLNSMFAYPMRQLGGVKVKIKRRKAGWTKPLAKLGLSKKFLLGELEVKIFPKANAGAFPGLASGNWSYSHNSEEAPGFSGPTIRKLSGQGGKAKNALDPFYRPLVTPAAQFWAGYRIPLALKMAAQNIRRTKLGSRPL